MKNIFLIVSFFCLISCKNTTETASVSKEEQENKLAEEQIATINLSEVDEYPRYALCNDTLPKEDKLKCLELGISRLYSDALKKHSLVIADSLKDTVIVVVKVDRDGKLAFERTESSDRTRELLPQLDSILTLETSGFEPLIPAKKQELNVATLCKFPLIINVK